MNNFQFYNPVKIIFGKGTIAKLTKELPKDQKILICYGGGSVLRNGVMDQVRKALADHNTIEFGGIEPNPKYATLMKAVDVVKAEGVDMLLSVGGGSVLDGTKFIAAATYYEGSDAYDICRKGEKITKALPICDVMTLAATGSEMNSGGVISNSETNEKFPFGSPLLFPKFSILDPETLYSLPKEQIANGIVDTFIHVVEQYITTDVNTPIQDRYAEGILLTLIEEACNLMDEESEPNYDSYANFMWAATNALNGYIATGVVQDWATHHIGHEITALKGYAHARTLAIVLPGVLRTFKSERSVKLDRFARRVWGIYDGNADVAIDKTEEFFNTLGVKTKLSDYGLGADFVEDLKKKFTDRGQDNIGFMGVKVGNLDQIFSTQL